MNIYAENPEITFDINGKAKITFDILPESKFDLLSNADYIMQSKRLSVDIARGFRHRSLDANAMFWSLCGKLAEALETSNDEMYIKLLYDYGTFFIASFEEKIDEAKYKEETGFRIVDYVGASIVFEREVYQYKCFPGTSTYDTKQMSRLIKGALFECRELGIPTESSEDIKEMFENLEGGIVSEKNN